MSSFHGYFPIIHAASGATPECHTYLKVYGGTGGGSAIINGLPINVGAGSTIDITVKSITGVTGNVYLLGMKKNVLEGSNTLGGYGDQLPNLITGTYVVTPCRTIVFNGELVVTGTLEIRPNSTLIINGSLVDNGTIINNGTLEINP
jgi:hypothetical protein